MNIKPVTSICILADTAAYLTLLGTAEAASCVPTGCVCVYVCVWGGGGGGGGGVREFRESYSPVCTLKCRSHSAVCAMSMQDREVGGGGGAELGAWEVVFNKSDSVSDTGRMKSRNTGKAQSKRPDSSRSKQKNYN